MRTRTFWVDIESLNLMDKKTAGVIIRLMMAINDLTISNKFMDDHKKVDQSMPNYLRMGIAQYFLRLQISHLYEAMKIVKEIKKDEELLTRVKQCGTPCFEAFSKLSDFDEENHNNKLKTLLNKTRNKLAFHYDQKFVEEALADRAKNSRKTLHKFIFSEEDLSYRRFELADNIVETIICHQIGGISRDADIFKEIEELMELGFELHMNFIRFSYAFISQLCPFKS